MHNSYWSSKKQKKSEGEFTMVHIFTKSRNLMISVFIISVIFEYLHIGGVKWGMLQGWIQLKCLDTIEIWITLSNDHIPKFNVYTDCWIVGSNNLRYALVW